MLKKTLESLKDKLNHKEAYSADSDRKYEILHGDYKDIGTTRYYRIKALRHIDRPLNLPSVEAGDLGGYVSREDCLSHEGTCWVGDMALVSGEVSGDAQVSGQATVQFPSVVTGLSYVSDYARVLHGAFVEDSKIINTATVTGNATYITNSMIAKLRGDVPENESPIRETIIKRSVIMDNAHVANGVRIEDSTVSGSVYLAGNISVKDRSMIHGAIALVVESAPLSIENVILEEPVNSNGSPNAFTTGYRDKGWKITPDSCDITELSHKSQGASDDLQKHIRDSEKHHSNLAWVNPGQGKFTRHWRKSYYLRATRWSTRNPNDELLEYAATNRVLGVYYRKPLEDVEEFED